uniref:Uncharacterized protein n=1 Tax=Utricularia reniformis TaxID=192314 RepID=A0A1Y0B3K6_9LAMI|nr:hypothetical protein AEK19_MT1831 [Utricularia reniformis]ART32002.1 hypothetical protein AEK19_MT1831 [Utricularia reniformis]
MKLDECSFAISILPVLELRITEATKSRKGHQLLSRSSLPRPLTRTALYAIAIYVRKEDT